MATDAEPRATSKRLDEAATEAAGALRDSGFDAPDVLLFPATGPGELPAAMGESALVPLRDVPGVPRVWHDASLRCGFIGPTSTWLIDDAPATGHGTEPAWVGAFPIWMAAAAGTRLLVHASAGTALVRDGDRALGAGDVARCTDHINLSGTTPLTGLGESRLGPLFPDQTRVHDTAMARVADEAAGDLGLDLRRAVAACTVGPALSTPAELRWFASAGADIAVQRLAAPLVAAAHAGLATLALAAVTDCADEAELDVAELVARAARTAPTLDRLVTSITERLAPLARQLAEEESV